MWYICTANKERLIGLWCNGNTTDSGPVILGSNPSSPTGEVFKSLGFKGFFLGLL